MLRSSLVMLNWPRVANSWRPSEEITRSSSKQLQISAGISEEGTVLEQLSQQVSTILQPRHTGSTTSTTAMGRLVRSMFWMSWALDT